jgi:hypothetical protein
MRLRVLIVFSCFLILATTSSAQVRSEPDANILSACAAFAPNGISAFAEVETKGIFLEISSADGKVSHLNLPLRYPPPASQPTNRTINRRVEIAHRRCVSGRESGGNHARINNSPATGSTVTRNSFD